MMADKRSLQATLALLLLLVLVLAQAESLFERKLKQKHTNERPLPYEQLTYDVAPGGSYSALVNTDGLMGEPSGLATLFEGASKRSRKVSAFMPMRGRKDGRDSAAFWPQLPDSNSYLLPSQQGPWTLVDGRPAPVSSLVAPPMALSESDGDGTFLMSTPEPSSDLDAASTWTATPKGFATRFASRRLAALTDQGGADIPPGPMMQAKLRRAFQPMRGKKSLVELVVPDDSQPDT